MRQQPEFYIDGFAYLQLQRHMTSNPEKFDMLVARGRAALAANDLSGVREACVGLVGITNFPKDQEADVTALAGLRR